MREVVRRFRRPAGAWATATASNKTPATSKAFSVARKVASGNRA